MGARTYTPKQVAEIVRLADSGATHHEIGERFGRTRRAIDKLLSREKIAAASNEARKRAAAKVSWRNGTWGELTITCQRNGERVRRTVQVRRKLPWSKATIDWAKERAPLEQDSPYSEARIIVGEMARIYSRVDA